MAEKLEVQAVCEENRLLLKRARDLNYRAGENVFSVLSQREISVWLEKRLNGARNIWEIDSAETLRFPALDEELIQLVISENPDTTRVLDAEFPVEYRGQYLPRVTLRKESGADRWQELPDEGVKLTGGRAVEVVLSFDYYTTLVDSNIPKLKEKVKNHLNQKQWESWKERPAISAPNLEIDGAVLPEITEIVYGQCVITGESLKAFGVLQAHRGYYSSDPVRWEGLWLRTREEAESYQAKAQAEFEKELVKTREKREQEAVRKDAEAAKEQLRVIQSCNDWNVSAEYGLRSRVYERANAYYLPSTVSELKQWTVETLALVAEAKQALAEIQGKREEDERVRLVEERRKQNRRERVGGVPPGLLSKKAFNGNEDLAYDFMQKVAALPTKRLDAHIVQNCGRARVKEHLEEVSGDPDFFLGVDPNAVVFYVAEVHFYSRRDESDFGQDTADNSGLNIQALKKAWGAR